LRGYHLTFSENLISGFAITADDLQIGNTNILEDKIRTCVRFGVIN